MAETVAGQIFAESAGQLLDEWMGAMERSGVRRDHLLSPADLRRQSGEVVEALRPVAGFAGTEHEQAPGWAELARVLGEVSRSRALAGFTATQTATFVLSLKEPLFARLRSRLRDAEGLGAEVWRLTLLIDRVALLTFEEAQRTRDQVIARQQQDMLELSTPVVRLWRDVLAVPLIGTLDSARTQVVMETLLQQIVDTGASIAIIDITGVPTVDTLVAQHLLKTVTAARLMGADCIISGIRPQIAQTIVHLGVSLRDVTTKATLADAFAVALQRTGYGVTKRP